MDVKTGFRIFCLAAAGLIFTADAVDPNYLARAKILSRKEASSGSSSGKMFLPSGKKCHRIGEKAARMSMSCVADTQFHESLSNRVHMSRLTQNMVELQETARKISKCSYKYSKYFERGCLAKSEYLNARRRCRRLNSRKELTKCKGEIRRRFSGR